MAGIKKLAKVTVLLDFNENSYYAQNGVNGSSVKTEGSIVTLYLSFNGSKLFTFFVMHFLEMCYFPFVKWLIFLINIKIKGVSSSNKPDGIMNKSSTSM